MWQARPHIQRLLFNEERNEQKQLEDDGSSESENTMFGIEENESVERAMLKVNINKATVLMEVGTGAAVTIILKGI